MRRLASAALCLAAAACAAPGPYPSLAVRDVERRYAAEQAAVPEPPPPLPPADAALAERVRALIAEARRGQAAFAAELDVARAAVAAAGAPQGEAWVLAQQAVSRADAARTPTTRALGDLDAIAFEQAADAALTGSDLQLLTAGLEEIAELARAQDAALAALRARLRPA